MHGLAISFSLIAALVPSTSADAPKPAPAGSSSELLLAQAPTSPPPAEPVPPPPPAAPPAATVSTPASLAGLAPTLKGPSVWGVLPYQYGFGTAGLGVGARFMFPLTMIKPLLTSPTVRDSFAIEAGIDYLHYSFGYTGFGNYSVNVILPAVGVMWNIWLNGNLILYPKVELGYGIVSLSGYPAGVPTTGYSAFYWDIAGGAMYKLNGGLTLRAELGSAGLKAGVGWLF